VHGPDDDLLLRSKHVAFYVIKLVVLDVKMFLVILNRTLNCLKSSNIDLHICESKPKDGGHPKQV
jgi:hypothetical protein